MPTVSVSIDLEYEVFNSSTMLLKVLVPETSCQRVAEETLEFQPHVAHKELRDFWGNRLALIKVEPSTLFKISYNAEVELISELHPSTGIDKTDIKQLPALALKELNPSRYCESDRLSKLAGDEFGHIDNGYEQVQQVCDWVNAKLTYSPGSTNAWTTATEVLVLRAGVCRDYAHLAIALCRALGIPARYVSGYAVDLYPPDFHGLFEAYLAGTWYLFDATKLAPRQGVVRIATGVDASETAFNTIYGNAVPLSMSVAAHIKGEQAQLAFTTSAVSNS